jgi:hypothetical protein
MPIRRGAPFKVRVPLPILRRRVGELCTQFVTEFGQPESKGAWVGAEKLAGQIMGVQPMPSSHPYDYEILVDSKVYRVEVKYSKLYWNDKQWRFVKTLGESGRRRFDILLLIGLADRRFLDRYHPDATFTRLVFFAIPFSAVKAYCYQGRYRQIDVPTDPQNHRRKAAPLYRYQIGAVGLWRGRALGRVRDDHHPWLSGSADRS